jgi:hypothetical protein
VVIRYAKTKKGGLGPPFSIRSDGVMGKLTYGLSTDHLACSCASMPSA